jgi:hypothetical protein
VRWLVSIGVVAVVGIAALLLWELRDDGDEPAGAADPRRVDRYADSTTARAHRRSRVRVPPAPSTPAPTPADETPLAATGSGAVRRRGDAGSGAITTQFGWRARINTRRTYREGSSGGARLAVDDPRLPGRAAATCTRTTPV